MGWDERSINAKVPLGLLSLAYERYGIFEAEPFLIVERA
jgi:hypothetical protein